MATTYKIRKFVNGKNAKGEPFTNYSLTIPSEVARELPEGVVFTCELNEEGILFRPATPEQTQANLPSWAENGAPQTPAKPKASRKAPAKADEPKAEVKEAAKTAAKKTARKAPAKKAAAKTAAKAPRPRPGAKAAA